ncbi:hypothetical protein F3Y22_tig00110656pilonHSYRG00134 [Hibiscus syriacus]|uniref:Uncharacterized protein n=1 Tax=Hibiscus syriacus TaxID=106335 RepID=A0A6A2ZZC5_HIBSY|nr:hypothetical protein F3Y22_tig00110656pilonHSYRG00134 [Hibiscus syriacus]
MQELIGSPGTVSGLTLRITQSAFAAASIASWSLPLVSYLHCVLWLLNEKLEASNYTFSRKESSIL